MQVTLMCRLHWGRGGGGGEGGGQEEQCLLFAI